MVLSREQTVAYGIDLMLTSKDHMQWYIGDLDTYLLLPINNNRIRIYLKGTEPVGLITWCWMYPKDALSFLQDEYHPSDEDFRDDDIVDKEFWILDMIGLSPCSPKYIINNLSSELTEIYGPIDANWRRLKARDKRRTKRFNND